jgi:hypothetical protein
VAEVTERAAQWDRLVRRMAVAFTAANLAGGVILFVFLGLILPTPAEVARDWDVLWTNFAVFAPGAVVSTLIANWLGRARVEPVREWFVSGREADAAARAAVLHQPVAQAMVSVIVWTAATVLFTALNAFI